VPVHILMLARGVQLDEELGYGFESRWYHWNFTWLILQAPLWSVVDWASDRNGYREYIMGVKTAGM